MGGVAKVAASPYERLAWLVLALGAACVLALARWLTPSPSGVGTHEQLGLPPCGVLAWLGFPCPACGLTTAFAYLAHGDWLASLTAHPLGAPLFLVTCALVPGSLWASIRGVGVMEAIDRLKLDRAALLFVLSALAVWAIRLSTWPRGS